MSGSPYSPTRLAAYPWVMSDETTHSNIVLTGFMGTGKTTVARLLAHELGREFVDTDAMIVDRHGPIAGIFAEQGEARFREIEMELSIELAGRSGLVIASGGGMLLTSDVAERFVRSGRVFCLTAESDTILGRVVKEGAEPDRPLLAGPDAAGRVAELLAERAACYSAFEQVPTDDRSPAEVMTDIVSRLGARVDGG